MSNEHAFRKQSLCLNYKNDMDIVLTNNDWICWNHWKTSIFKIIFCCCLYQSIQYSYYVYLVKVVSTNYESSVVWIPAREYFAHMNTSPLEMKVCKRLAYAQPLSPFSPVWNGHWFLQSHLKDRSNPFVLSLNIKEIIYYMTWLNQCQRF